MDSSVTPSREPRSGLLELAAALERELEETKGSVEKIVGECEDVVRAREEKLDERTARLATTEMPVSRSLTRFLYVVAESQGVSPRRLSTSE